jgi:hypothetical protein
MFFSVSIANHLASSFRAAYCVPKIKNYRSLKSCQFLLQGCGQIDNFVTVPNKFALLPAITRFKRDNALIVDCSLVLP